MAKKKMAKRAPAKKKTSFCEELTARTRTYQTTDLAVRRFEWQGTVAVPVGEGQVPTNLNRNSGGKEASPKTKQTVSLNADGTPDLKRIREQTERKGSQPID